MPMNGTRDFLMNAFKAYTSVSSSSSGWTTQRFQNKNLYLKFKSLGVLRSYAKSKKDDRSGHPF